MHCFSEREERIHGGCQFSTGCDGAFWVYTDDGRRNCDSCGGVDPKYREFDSRPPWSRDYAGRAGARGVISWGFSRGRYKEKFHFNERVAQWCLRDPLVPTVDWVRIHCEAHSGRYGPIEDFTRSTIVTLTRNLRFQKYRERWKRILYDLTHIPYDTPSQETVEWLDNAFERVVSSFVSKRKSMPFSVARDGSLSPRHNFMSYNYVIVKLLEALGEYRFHWEFPLPRSHIKLHALDDVFAPIAEEMGLYFHRSVVIKRSKYKRS